MVPEPSERRLAAILFSDIAGYTALMAENEEAGLRVRVRHRDLLGPLAQRYRGALVDENGDELVLSFPSAVDAVNCALATQEALRDDAELKLRIGIHLGDVVFEGGRVYGDGVNVASRVRPLAEPGGSCVSDEVQHSVRNQPNIETAPLRTRKLKNVDRPVAVYAVSGTAVEPASLPKLARVRARQAHLRRWAATTVVIVVVAGVVAKLWQVTGIDEPIRSLAVLPLENLSGDPEQEYFSDGMTEALIGDLAKIASVRRVISRTSVMQYKGERKPLSEIARELDVDGVVEGTVMRAGDRVRITAQLIDARSDRNLWSDRYDRELSDVLALQSDVARAVAEQIRAELTPDEQAALATSRTVHPRAYDAYLRGLQLRSSPTLITAWGPPAIEQFERSVKLDPDFAEAWAWLALARFTLGALGFELGYRSEFPRAREAAQRALELDDRLGVAHHVLGWIRREYDWDFPGARRAFERALELSPNDPLVLVGHAWYLMNVEERSEEALSLSARLPLLAPFDLFIRADRARLFMFARRYERALEEFERLQELDPNFKDHSVAESYILLGRFEEAHRAYIEFWEQCGARCDWQRDAAQRGWTEGGWEGSVRAWLEAAPEREVSPWLIALNYARIGAADEALAWLERGYRERDPRMTDLSSHPELDPLRPDPRFQDLLRRMNFPGAT